jgi:hypothetical protein
LRIVAHVLTWDGESRTASSLLVRSFLLSLTVHLVLFGLIEVGHRHELWRFSPLAALARLLQPEVKALAAQVRTHPPRAAEPAPRRVEEVPVIFVDVDPSQASEEEPEQTKYYAAVQSRAGNPDTSRDTGQPRLDGTQELVPKTLDTERAAVPLQPQAPAAPRPAPPEAEHPPARPPDAAQAGPLVEPRSAPTAEPRPELKPGDLLMARPGPEQKPAPPLTAPPPPAPAAAPADARPRPRTLAAARAQMDQNPQSALVGQRMFQEGGVKRFSVVPALDTKGSPLGAYDARFVAAVQQCWYALLEEQRYSLDRLGKVVISFRLTAEGRITDMRVEESNVGEIYTTLCQLAITKPAPYEKWPADVRRLVGHEYRDIRFTFYY